MAAWPSASRTMGNLHGGLLERRSRVRRRKHALLDKTQVGVSDTSFYDDVTHNDADESYFNHSQARTDNKITRNASEGPHRDSSVRNSSFEATHRKSDEKERGREPIVMDPMFSCKLHTNENEELGGIRFHFFSALSEAQEQAHQLNRTLLIIVHSKYKPWGCISSSRDVLSHPLVVEAAENLFVSMATRNPSIAGASSEPEHKCTLGISNPVVRFVNGETGKDVVKRLLGRDFSAGSLASAMVQALHYQGKSVPVYLRMLAEEEVARSCLGRGGRCKARDAFLGVSCFCVAEVEAAGLDGVISTRAGWLNNRKLLKVTYDSSRLSYCSLVRHALCREYAHAVYYQTNDERVGALMELNRVISGSELIEFLGTFLPHFESKHALRQTVLRFVPLTDFQATRANRLVHIGAFDEAMHILSPRQGTILMAAIRSSRHKKWLDVTDVPVRSAWQIVTENGKHPTTTNERRPNLLQR